MNVAEELPLNYSSVRNEKLEYVFCDLTDTHLVGVIMKLFNTFNYSPWIFSLLASVLVSLSGIFPLLVIPVEEGENLKFGAGANRLRVLLSFAVGGLLGDVFLHLLPEAWEHELSKSGRHTHPSLISGLWVLIGMLVFIIVEKLSSSLESDKTTDVSVAGKGKALRRTTSLKELSKPIQERKKKTDSANWTNNNNDSSKAMGGGGKSETREHYHISGYLNLMANSVDNFTHGLAIGGSFSISFKMGLLSTFAILVHELPHEIGDFAILLKSGFSRWDAAKAQLCTAFAGVMGSMLAVVYGSSDSLQSKTSWILPFTAGGFLHIALVTVLPELVNEESKAESCKQLGSLVFGIGIMALLIAFFG